MLRPQHFHNIFTINHRWLVVISSNLNLTLRLFFCPNNNNLPLKICCKNIVRVLWAYHFSKRFQFQQKAIPKRTLSHTFFFLGVWGVVGITATHILARYTKHFIHKLSYNSNLYRFIYIYIYIIRLQNFNETVEEYILLLALIFYIYIQKNIIQYRVCIQLNTNEYFFKG